MLPLLTLLLLLGLLPVPGMLLGLSRRNWELFWSCLAVSDGFSLVRDLLMGKWGWAALDAVFMAAALWNWHDEPRKRGREKTSLLIGEKSRALRNAIVRTLRQSAKPRPVLRPVPGGALAECKVSCYS